MLTSLTFDSVSKKKQHHLPGDPAKVQDYGTDKSAYILKHMLLSFP
jgi:hypothetical protein